MKNIEDRKKKFLEYCNKNTDVFNVEKFVYEYFLTLSLYRPDNNKEFWNENIAELKKHSTKKLTIGWIILINYMSIIRIKKDW